MFEKGLSVGRWGVSSNTYGLINLFMKKLGFCAAPSADSQVPSCIKDPSGVLKVRGTHPHILPREGTIRHSGARAVELFPCPLAC